MWILASSILTVQLNTSFALFDEPFKVSGPGAHKSDIFNFTQNLTFVDIPDFMDLVEQFVYIICFLYYGHTEMFFLSEVLYLTS